MDVSESAHDSSWSDETEERSPTQSDVINYYIQPVNEYENTVLILYENYMESQGYQDPICAKEKCKEKEKKATDVDDDDDDDDDGHDDNIEEAVGYEIPEKTETIIAYDILSNSPVELFLFVDGLGP